MEFFLILFGIVGLVWFMAAQRHLSVLVGSLLVILIGVTFGHPFFNINLGPIPLTIDRALLVWLIMASFVLWKLGRADLKSFNRTDVIVLSLVGLLIASTFLHDWQYKEKLPLSRLLFFNLIPVSIYFAAKHCRIQFHDMRVFCSILIIFGIYAGFTAICEQRGLYSLVFPTFILDPVHWEFLGRARGPFLNPVSCGIFLSTCIAGSAVMWNVARPITRVFLGLTIGICVVASILTLTRSVWVGCALTLGIIAWFPTRPQVRGALIVVGTLLMALAALTLSDKINRFQRDKDVTEAQMAQSAQLRPMLASVAMRMTADKPVFGHGFGQYTKAKKPYHYNHTNGMQLSLILPYMQHNVFLSYLTETGIAGCALLCLLLGTLAFKSWQLWSSRWLRMEERRFALIGLAFVGVYVFNGMFHDVSIIPHVNALFFLLLGVTENLASSKIAVAGRIDQSPELDGRSVAA